MRQRIVTGLLAALIFIGILIWGGYAYSIFILLLAIASYYEFARLNRISGLGSGTIAGYAFVIFIILPLERWVPSISLDATQFVWLMMLVFLAMTVFFHNRANLRSVAVLMIGVLYIGYGSHYMLQTRLLPEDGLVWSLFTFGCIWLTDTGAYFSGMLFGKHLLASKISPKKTIEGAIGGMLVAILFAGAFTFVVPGWLDWQKAVVLGLAISIVGQLGDLIQSAYKRMQGVKDSGTLLPGHGGVLDRVDSWLIVFPFIHLLGFLA